MIITDFHNVCAEAAQAFIDRGWQPVPVPPGEKGPRINGWQNLLFTEEDFSEDGNIGLKLGTVSGGLVDVDLDCPEAIELAPHFLPETGMIHGRAGKPCSHYWYVVTNALSETHRYKDADGATLIELRSTGGQTIIPPSIHPSGEALHWHGGMGEPAQVSGFDLSRRVVLIAAIALIARHWPTNGGRHDCAMAVAGYLTRGGMDGDEVVGMVRYAAYAAGDEEVSDRERAALDTVLKIERGEKVTGGPTLASLVGEQVVSKLSEWLGLRQFSQNDWGQESEQRGNQRNPSTAKTIFSLAQVSGAAFFRTLEGEPYAHVFAHGHWETLSLHSGAARDWLKGLYYDATGEPCGKQAVDDVLEMLQMLANRSGMVAPVYIRIAPHNGAIYVDLGDATWDAVEITAKGWCVVSNPPVYFKRSTKTLPLPRPVHGGSLAELRPFVNVGDDEDAWVLLLAWLVGAYHPTGPYVHLLISAAQGSAKSTVARLLRRLVDPNAAELRRRPRTPQHVAIPTRHNRVLAFDNLSHMPDWLSDMLCTLSTGGTDEERALYTNDEEISFSGKMPVIVTSIGDIGTRGDLLERSIQFSPKRPAHRQTERQVYAAFEKAAPRILGALYDAVSMALRNADSVKVENPDRMADFEEWVVAAESALGIESGAFLAAYRRMLGGANELALEASPVGRAVLKFMHSRTEWTGTATELLGELNRMDTNHPLKGWPTDGTRMGSALRRVEPQLQQAGIEITYGRGRIITITVRETLRNASADSAFQSQPRQEGASERWNDGNAEIHKNPYDGVDWGAEAEDEDGIPF